MLKFLNRVDENRERMEFSLDEGVNRKSQFYLTFARVAKRSLETKMVEIEVKQDLVPSSAIALLMQEYGVVILKQQKEVLKTKQKEISSIRYPYLVTKVKEDSDNFLACKVDRCFAYDRELSKVAEKIEELVPHTSQ